MDNQLTYKEYRIPKRGKGYRKIVAPSPELLTYQRKLLPSIYHTFDKFTRSTLISDTFHGFIPGRNCVTAVTKHIGYQTTIMMDISNFFDSVTKSMAPTLFASDTNLWHADGYAAQGFATSPMLCNLALIPAAHQMQYYLAELPFDTVFSLYADDLCFSVNTEDQLELDSIIMEVTDILADQGFTINSTKTRIKYAKHGYRRILGINCGKDHIQPTRKTIRKARAALHQALHASSPEARQQAGRSLGGLHNWMNLRPAKQYKKEQQHEQNN